MGGAPAPEMSLGRFCGPIPGGGPGIDGMVGALRGGDGCGGEGWSGCASANVAKAAM
jgi:hypothetical protein